MIIAGLSDALHRSGSDARRQASALPSEAGGKSDCAAEECEGKCSSRRPVSIPRAASQNSETGANRGRHQGPLSELAQERSQGLSMQEFFFAGVRSL
jgi:hypothetical protein